uniref:Uncharacterized protein n=1 Tax=Sphaerodactylus townsendi TaxID=933632 RepID=A0ACB8EFU8_9SAUR
MFFLQSSEEVGRNTSALLSEKAPTPKEDHISCRVKEEAEFVQNSLEAELSAGNSLISSGVNLSCLVKEEDQDLKAIELPAELMRSLRKRKALPQKKRRARLPGGSQRERLPSQQAEVSVNDTTALGKQQRERVLQQDHKDFHLSEVPWTKATSRGRATLSSQRPTAPLNR